MGRRRGGGRNFGAGSIDHHVFSAAAGLFGALATVLGKLAGQTGNDATDPSSPVVWGVRAVLGGGVVVCNIAMWYCFTRCLESSDSSAMGSALNLASNFVTSVWYGL